MPQSLPPVSVKPHTQRTLKVVGGGLKAFFTTKVPGTLIIRKKKNAADLHCHRYIHWRRTPPVPDPSVPPPPDDSEDGAGKFKLMATVFPEDIHTDLVSNGIKVRDFAYPSNRVGHSTPVHPRPMALSPEGEAKAKNIPSCPDDAPMPSVSMTWQVPHPSLRPTPPPEDEIPWEAPTPEKPYVPIYETHRIPIEVNPVEYLLDVLHRLQQSPRTVPIRGEVTRRLLTNAPHLVDLSRYHEMDLEELRRYDRSIVWQLMNGIEPYPWYTDCHPSWVPSEDKLKSLATGFKMLGGFDAFIQRSLLECGVKKRLEDDEWQRERLQELRLENEQKGIVWGRNEDHLSPFDRLTEPEGVTHRQFLRVWERRMDSDQADPQYAFRVAGLKLLNTLDAGDADDEMTSMEVDPYDGVTPPFRLGQPEIDIPPCQFWGPNAVWDGYRLHSGKPSGKTLNEYLAEFSRCVVEDSPWPPSPPKRKFDELSEDDSEEEAEVETGPSQKRARV
ncbi:hypothetical protein B0H19DRAFT_1098243 [Mycena capillaripes]|nr:hypothetical protein B0H19DRAFT_1098243 [Mycena capillaripes]